MTEGDLVEVLGNLKAGDMVVRRANDEMRDGTALQAQRQVSLRSESRLAGRSILRRQLGSKTTLYGDCNHCFTQRDTGLSFLRTERTSQCAI